MGKDVGTSILTGATAERFEIVKWFYIEADDDTGYDAAADIIAHAMTNLHPAIANSATTEQDEPAPVARDLLDDIAAVLGADKVPAADIPARLRRLAPDWDLYRSITGLDIRRFLQAERAGRGHGRVAARHRLRPGAGRHRVPPNRRRPIPPPHRVRKRDTVDLGRARHLRSD